MNKKQWIGNIARAVAEDLTGEHDTLASVEQIAERLEEYDRALELLRSKGYYIQVPAYLKP